MIAREPLGYRIKEDSDDDDIGEVISSRKKFSAIHDRMEISFFLCYTDLYM